MKNLILDFSKNNSIYKRCRIFCIASLLTLGSCDDFVTVEVPSNQLSSPLVFDSNSTATAALVAIYSQIRSKGLLTGGPSGLQLKLGEYTDELTFFGSGGQTDTSFYNNSVLQSNSTVKNWWDNTYSQIYAVNAVLQGVENSTKLSTAEKNQINGEALFIRGMLHFHLTNLFGDIPYVINTDYILNKDISKTIHSEVFNKVENDLKTAELLLKLEYLSTDRVRPNKATAQALLARLYLYSGKWSNAAESASNIINQEILYGGPITLENIFLKNSNKTIWQLKPSSDGNNTLEAQANIFLQGPPPVSALSTNFVNSFEPGDNRRILWIKQVTKNENKWYHAYKYKAYQNTSPSVEYSIIFRTAEQYLIRAEAKARQGDLTAAKADLNIIRNAAGLPNASAVTETDLIAAILDERKHELFTEAHRFFDLKRYGLLNATLSSTKPDWDNNDQLLPLPETELLLNPNLNPQNPGY